MMLKNAVELLNMAKKDLAASEGMINDTIHFNENRDFVSNKKTPETVAENRQKPGGDEFGEEPGR